MLLTVTVGSEVGKVNMDASMLSCGAPVALLESKSAARAWPDDWFMDFVAGGSCSCPWTSADWMGTTKEMAR